MTSEEGDAMTGELPNQDERLRVIAEHILVLRPIIEKLRKALQSTAIGSSN
jgi:hypothetical protein